jgi:hypothetical protein
MDFILKVTNMTRVSGSKLCIVTELQDQKLSRLNTVSSLKIPFVKAGRPIERRVVCMHYGHFSSYKGFTANLITFSSPSLYILSIPILETIKLASNLQSSLLSTSPGVPPTMSNHPDIVTVRAWVQRDQEAFRIQNEWLDELQNTPKEKLNPSYRNVLQQWDRSIVKDCNKHLSAMEDVDNPSVEERSLMQELNKLVNLGDHMVTTFRVTSLS